MNVIIASDFHIRYFDNEEDRLRKEIVIEFLRTLIGKTDLLILNGDIFDLWFVWNSVIIKGYFSILKVLTDIQASGCRIVFIAGNHDFWFKDFLSKEIKIEIYPEFFAETIDGLRFFVAHGDRFTINDYRYKLFRSFIRNKIVMHCFELIHPDLSLRLGMLMSRSSRKVKIPAEAVKKREQGLFISAKKKSAFFDLVVFGHSHRSVQKNFEKGIYINTGDWIKGSSYLQIKEGQIKLQEYKKKE
jgi:UDP-2,3-diacylglucosamine hydrolase